MRIPTFRGGNGFNLEWCESAREVACRLGSAIRKIAFPKHQPEVSSTSDIFPFRMSHFLCAHVRNSAFATFQAGQVASQAAHAGAPGPGHNKITPVAGASTAGDSPMGSPAGAASSCGGLVLVAAQVQAAPARVGLVATGTLPAAFSCAHCVALWGFSECAHDSELPLIAAPPTLSGMC